MTRAERTTWLAIGVAVALVPGALMWGFTVDDALIAVRYGESLAAGAGYRFEPAGPATDGVTPLPWAPILAALAWIPSRAPDALDLLGRAKVLGLVAWTASAMWLAVEAGRGRRLPAAVALALLAVAFPVSAWAASGMETGIATALATAAACAFPRPFAVAVVAGLATAFRPEMAPWAVAISAGAGLSTSARVAVVAAAVASAPFALCAVVRVAVFGRPTPLAVLAKPSDLDHGATYALAASLVLLVPLLATAPVSIARGTPRARAIAVAFLVHAVAVALAGGDWMPYARLLVPVVPALVLVVADLALEGRAARVAFGVRAVAATVLGALLALRAAPAGRSVMSDRTVLVLAARPVLAEANVVAALDVGWVSAATTARIVDLAGLTDPEIAVLGGGHTSKRVDLSMLEARGVDCVVVYEPPRVVERRIVEAPRFAEIFTRSATLPLGATGATYAIYRRVPR